MTKTIQQLQSAPWKLDLGAQFNKNGTTTFKVWAPHHYAISLQILGKPILPMHRDANGYFTIEANEIYPGERYTYVLENGLQYPDPVSRSLPEGVHGPSEIVDPNSYVFYDTTWKGLNLRDLIFYEIHVGTFSSHRTFEGVIQKLDYLKNLGINCIEIMPIAQFPGQWNWGYDGASLYAPYSGYGGVEGFKQLVDTCHAKGIAVCLDVVYNHLGPEGNHLSEFGPYFSNTYHTPWGKAFNFDGAYSDHVREYVIKNALYWITEYHIDVLRLDAIHGIYDFSASVMLAELTKEIKQLQEKLDRKIHVVAEAGLNDSKVVRPHKVGGLSIDGMWNDDFHHAAHVMLTGERDTYYIDFNGLNDLSKVLTKGSVYTGQYSPFRKKRHGNSFEEIPFEKLIVFLQNHDQIGNRPLGERLSTLLGLESQQIAACLLLMTPYIPLLFMGEEYGETAPFEYFVDFQDEKLMRSIYEGRKREFHRQEMPFPGRESFVNSCLTWKADPEIFQTYADLIHLRKKYPAKPEMLTESMSVYFSKEHDWIAWEYPTEEEKWIGVFCHLSKEKTLEIETPFHSVAGKRELFSTKSIDLSQKTWEIPKECAFVIT
ncbi:MAG: Malto-oligosyltrehalose trehalohydrolase [Chlamydiales bacterium]|nr:Malto-oligosyltrehalose trehalohydrolase [Chlamydiales bacterium]